MKLGAACLVAGLALAAPPDVSEIVHRSVAVNDADFAAQSGFGYTVTEAEDGGHRTYRVTMMQGSPYRRLVAVNGQPLSSSGQAEEERKYRQALQHRARESAQARRERIAKYRQEQQEEHLLIREMTKALRFHYLGEQRVGGYDTYQLAAVPNPAYRPINEKAKVLKHMRGTLWIAKDSYHWVKVEAEVTAPVSFAGFLARVEPGTRFLLENMPVNDRVWLPKHFSMSAKARILGLFSHNSSEDDVYRDYHPAGGMRTD